MTKRLLSIFVAVVMMISCCGLVSFAEDTRYEGIVYFQAAEDMLKELNTDVDDASLWDNEDRKDQEDTLIDSTTAFPSDFSGANLVENWDDYCARVLTRDGDGIGSRDGNVIYYLKMMDIFKTDNSALTPELLAVKEEFSSRHLAPEYDVEGLSLRDSLAKLDAYTYQMGLTISHHRTVLDNYDLSAEKKTEYMLKGTKALYQIAFENQYGEFRNAFDNKFLGDDEGKKLISVMYGKTLTTELATDNISDVMVGFINNNFVSVKNEFGEMVKENCDADTKEAVFKFLRNTVSRAYMASATTTDEQKADIIMLFGNPDVTGDKGALQLMFEALGSSTMNEYGMINTWFNLFLREHIQLAVRGERAENLKSGVDVESNRILMQNNSSAALNVEKLDRYGIAVESGLLSIGSDWLDMKVYNEDRTINTYVSYSKSGGKFSVSYDKSRPAEYPGYIQLVRNDGTFIETYPITVVNKKTPGITPGGGSSVDTPKYKLIYDSNGGTKIATELYAANETAYVNKVPVKEGYVFEGWYLDEELTQYVKSVVMVRDTVVYAKWVEDNGTAGGNHPTPDTLNGDDHFAYVIGYPDGTVRPENNITRAEVASIFFRLLKEEVREEKLTTYNVFTDVEDGEWYNMAVSTLADLGIIVGRTPTEFVPNAPITRAEFAAICARFDDSDYAIADNFSDISGHWAEGYIREAAARGWIKGYEDATFRPDRLITRAETMTLINRILNRVPETKEDLLPNMIKWVDNTEAYWYYLPVQEATNSHTFEMKDHVYEKWVTVEEVTDWTQYQK